MRPYLAVQYSGGTVVLSDHDTDSDYALYDPSLPAPEVAEWARVALITGAQVHGPRDEYATRTLPLACLGTALEAEDALNALSIAVSTHRARLLWRSRSDSPLIWTTIRQGRVAEDISNMNARSAGYLRAAATLTTDAEWTGAEEAITTDSITVNKGDRPARMRLKVTSSSANPLIGLGIKHAPSADYDPHEVIASPAAVTLTAGYIDLHAPAAIDTNAHRGAHVLAAKVATTDAATRYRAKVVTAGSGIALSATATHDSVLALATAARWQVLPGPVSIPAGGVPGIATGSGYAASVEILSQTTATAYAPNVTNEFIMTAAGRLDSIVVKAKLTAVTGFPTIQVFNDADVEVYRSTFTAGVTGTIGTAFDLEALPNILLAAGTYTARATGLDIEFGYDTTTSDAYAVVSASPPLGFDTEVIVQGANSTGTGTLSSATLLPADDFAAAWEKAFGANQGVLIENTDPLSPPATYITTSTAGTAGPALAACMWHGTPRLRPGVNEVVTACDGTLTISGVWMPCYSNAAAGSL